MTLFNKNYLLIIIILLMMIFIFSQTATAAQLTCNCGAMGSKIFEVPSNEADCPQLCKSIMAGASYGCRESGDCQLNDLTNIVVNVINIIYGLVGSIILLFFIYGGFVWLTSGGNKERVTKGKQIIINSVIGMVIVFLSYTIVGLIFQWLGISEFFGNINWFK